MSDKYTLGIDIGTTGVKASVLDVDAGKVVAHSLKEHPLFHPKPGYAEQEGDNYWKAVVEAVQQCFKQGSFADKISGVSLSGLVGVMLPIDKDGKPVRPGMIWMDSRSEEECTDIRNTVGEATINKINGNRVAPWFVEPKALWMKKHEPHNFEKTYKLVSPSGYCTYKMCGEFTMNHGDAQLFYPYEYQKGVWNEELANGLGISLDKYPDIYNSHEVVGKVTKQASEETGIKEGAVVVAGGTDISCAALGCGVVEVGQAFYSMGTGANIGVMIPTSQEINEFRILKWTSVLPGMTMFDGPMAFVGASLNWFKNNFAELEIREAEKNNQNVFELLTKQAEKIKSGSDGLMYFPYLGNTLSPNWNSTATGLFFGVRPTTTKAHFIRSVIEGVAFDCNSNVKIAKEAGAKIDKFTLNGGPTKSRLWNQITSDVTGLPLDLPDVGKSEESGFPPEAAPLGDAILAAVGAGFYSNPLESLSDIIKIKETFEPNLKNHEMYSEFFSVWRSVYHNLIDDMKKHHELLNKYDFS